MRRSDLDRWRENQRAKLGYVQLNGLDDMIKLMVDDRPMSERQINPTQSAFIKSDEMYKAYMGPAGCAKTTTGVVDVFLKALCIPGSKWFIARRDYNDLLGTTMDTAVKVLNRLPSGTLMERSKAPPTKWWIRPMMRRAHRQEEPSEITFMGLSDSIGSYEFNGGFVDEADEVELKYINELKGRLRHKPYPDYPSTGYSIGLAFNPPSKAHWLYAACTGRDEQDNDIDKPWLKLFRPEPRENARNLREGYYDGMDSMTADLRQRLRDGVWGSTFPGLPVIRQFKRDLHVKSNLTYKFGTLFRWWDFGYNYPCCLFVQVSKAGQVQVLRMVKGRHIEARQFGELVLERTAEWFPEAGQVQDLGDPAVAQKKDTGQTLAVLNQVGIQMRYLQTPFDLSLNLLRKKFETLIEGEPAIAIDQSCTSLIDALCGGYHFKDDGITPHKGVYDHEVDCLRYGVWSMFGATMTRVQGLPTSIAFWSKKAS